MSKRAEKRIRVMLVDDSILIREGIRAVIEANEARPKIVVSAEAATAADCLAQARADPPDVILLDVRLPGRSGIEVCRELQAQQVPSKVIILTSLTDHLLAYDAVIAGAIGFLQKEVDSEDLIRAIRAAAQGAPVLTSQTTLQIFSAVRATETRRSAPPTPALTGQESRVLGLLTEGMSNKEIATALGISPNTAKHYIANTYEKLGVSNRAAAVACFLKKSPPESWAK